MFWNRKKRLPITPEDQIWAEESLAFLNKSLGEGKLLSFKTVTPTKEFFDRDFDGSEKDAHFILDRCLVLMGIQTASVQLEFFSEQHTYLEDGTLLSSQADLQGRTEGAAGTYQKKGGTTIIRLEHEQLKRPEDLIGTIAHELAHEKLLGEHRILENDEYLTDLTAIALGFGIFIGNARFQFASGTNGSFGWQMRSQGYLPEQLIAYVMASLSLKKQETNTNYTEHLTTTLQGYFNQSIAYLNATANEKSTTVFWQEEKSAAKQHLFRRPEAEEAPVISFIASDLKKLRQEMMEACYADSVDAVERLLKLGLSPNFNTIGGSPLAIATKRRSRAVIDCLLRYGADINFSEKESLYDTTPMMAACKDGNLLMVQELVKAGAEINHVGGNGKSPLQIAVENGHGEVVKVLVENGANLEIKSGTSYLQFTNTPICFAALSDQTEMVSLLASLGAKTKPLRKVPRHELNRAMVKFLKLKKYL